LFRTCTISPPPPQPPPLTPNPTPPPPENCAWPRLEVDLLMGAFATQHLSSLTAPELATYEKILGRETLDLYNLILGKEAPPPELEGPVLERIKAFVQTSPLGRADPAAYARTKGTYSN
jgi:succinate dehydrogenase flavin-adding protein (antitoxin of CptAB toxin-antitoxin module)